MKNSAKKIWLTVATAVVVIAAIVTGIVMLRDQHQFAAAQTAPTELTLSVSDDLEKDDDGTIVLVPGMKFTLTATVTSTRNAVWSGTTIYVGALTTADGTGNIDSELGKNFSVNGPIVSSLAQEHPEYYVNVSNDLFGEVRYTSGTNKGQINQSKSFKGLLLSISFQDIGIAADSAPSVFTAELVVSEDILQYFEDNGIDTPAFSFGMAKSNGNSVGYGLNQNPVDKANTNDFVANQLSFRVREASEDNTLKDLEVGHDSSALTSLAVASDVDGGPAVVPDAPEYTFDFDDLTSFHVKPTANDANAKIEVALNQQVTFTEVTSGNSETLTLVDPSTLTVGDHNMLYVKVTAENGVSKTYTVTVFMGYVRLNSITASASTPTSGVTKNGLDLSATSDTYDKDTFAYNVFVPSDYDTDGGSVTLNASVLTGYDASTTIALSGSGCEPKELDGTTAATQLTSAGTVLLKSFAFPANEGDAAPTLTLTATASDGKTQKVYTLTFIEVSVNADIDTVVVTGVETSKVFENDDTQGVDYYYLLVGETQKKASVAIAAKSTLAKVSVGWADDTVTDILPDYTNPTVYGEGKYTITITAEAGNTKTYTFTLAASLYLELNEDSIYQFLTENLEAEDDEDFFYRRAYPEVTLDSGETLEHGVNDLDFDMVVLGQIEPETTVNAFLANIASPLTLIKLYDNSGELIYDCGAPGEDVDEADLDDSEMYQIGTGWRLVYGTEDEIYLSVLGDVNGDGYINALDSSRINSNIQGYYSFEEATDLPVRLAAYVRNVGYVAALDSSAVNSIIQGFSNVTDYYYFATPSASDN